MQGNFPPKGFYDRSKEDIGKILFLEHINFQIPEQPKAIDFYVVGLGLTRDPFMMVGTDNMWINAGRNQFHLLSLPVQRMDGVIGLVLPDIDALQRRLDYVAPRLAGTRFGYTAHADHVDVVCPWGNVFRCHAPDAGKFGRFSLGMPYIQVNVRPGTAERIGRFYQAMFDVPPKLVDSGDGLTVHIPVGLDQTLRFRETTEPIAPYDGYHIQIYVNDFSGPYERMGDLVFEESNSSQYRFADIIDLETRELLVKLEHEVRSMWHPMFGRQLVNRNPTQSSRHYVQGADAWTPTGPAIEVGTKVTVAPPT